MNLLAIGAHPDDIEYGCAGTLMKFADSGRNVYLLICTKGEAGGEADTRRREQVAAGELMGVRDVFWGGFRDTELPLGKELISCIEDTIRKVKPDCILVNHGEDTHQDHRALAKAAVSATRYIRNVLFYETPTTENFNPQIYVDVSSVLERKLRVLEVHESQVMKTNIEGLSITDLAHANATFRGIQGRVRKAEGFAALRYFIQF